MWDVGTGRIWWSGYGLIACQSYAVSSALGERGRLNVAVLYWFLFHVPITCYMGLSKTMPGLGLVCIHQSNLSSTAGTLVPLADCVL